MSTKKILPVRGEETATLLGQLSELLSARPWAGVARRDQTLLKAALGELGRAQDLAAASPARPSEAVELAQGSNPEELAIARACVAVI